MQYIKKHEGYTVEDDMVMATPVVTVEMGTNQENRVVITQ